MTPLFLSALLIAQQAPADEGDDFTFKRVQPPKAGQKKKINVQVERTWPYDSPRDKVEEPDESNSQDSTGTSNEALQAWFWSAISPDIGAADPIRLDRALRTLNENLEQKSAISPNAEMMNRIVRLHGANILVATAGKRVSPALALAVIAVESGGQVEATSPKGAKGLMQLIPATAKRFNVIDPTDPQQNISGGVAYLDWLLGKFGGDPILSLAGYNAGENAVIQNNGVPPFPETRAYVPKVVAAWDRARMYCQTIPKFADDGCVFDLNRSFEN